MSNIVNLPKPKPKSNRQKMVDALFQSLEANTHREIAKKMAKWLGHPINVRSVGPLISYLRKHKYEFGWTIPGAKFGKPAKSSKGNRFFAVLVERGSAPQFDPGHEIHINEGNTSAMRHAATSLSNQGDMFLMAAAAHYYKGPMAEQMARHIGRQLTRVKEDIAEFIEMFGDDTTKAA